MQGYCDCVDDPMTYTEECEWDGGDCEGKEELCEKGMEAEEPPADGDTPEDVPEDGDSSGALKYVNKFAIGAGFAVVIAWVV